MDDIGNFCSLQNFVKFLIFLNSSPVGDIKVNLYSLAFFSNGLDKSPVYKDHPLLYLVLPFIIFENIDEFKLWFLANSSMLKIGPYITPFGPKSLTSCNLAPLFLTFL
jgi:hypothetical protein